MKRFIALFLFLASALSICAKTKIACVGDSITFGSGIADRNTFSYPAQLAALLGDDYEVKNFGVSGRTMLKKGDHPYIEENQYKASLAFRPDVVIIKLGTNDSKPHNWKHKAEYLADTKSLIAAYRKLKSKPRIILCKPVPVFGSRWGISEAVVGGEIGELLEKAAFQEKVELIDLHIPLREAAKFFPDRIHPNAKGAEVIAKHIGRHLVLPRERGAQSLRGKSGQFHGYEVVDIKDAKEGNLIRVVRPKKTAKGKPWVWRARFWGHQPQLDIQLLELGYHVVFCDVADLFGASSAVERWNRCYEQTQKLGLSKKALLEGMSRGGLIIHNWAVANPDKVAGLIGDNCVMDFKSWPAGFFAGKRSAGAWALCKKAYGFKTDEEAKAYKSNPVDTVEVLVKSGIPLMYLIGDKDGVVPASENSALVEKKIDGYKHLTTIHKPNGKHHPHSLPDPKPMTDFALKCYGLGQTAVGAPVLEKK